MSLAIPNIDKAGKAYWDKTERNQQVEQRAFDPHPRGVRNFGKRAWHAAFQNALQGNSGTNRKLVELGCGGSAFLPYFSRQYGFQTCGIDYSEQGCESARNLCEQNGVHANILCADFFQAPLEIFETFDVVVSFGVVEHFTDTAQTLHAFAKFLKPGGVMITTVPNLVGLVGSIQNLLAPDVFEKHVVIDRNGLRIAHGEAGLAVSHCDYFLFTNFGVVNAGQHPSMAKKLAFGLLRGMTGISWAVESVIGPLPNNRYSSPYLMAVARKAK